MSIGDKYEVNVRVFPIGGYNLKKGDVIEVVDTNINSTGDTIVLVNNVYFKAPIWKHRIVVQDHCEKL